MGARAALLGVTGVTLVLAATAAAKEWPTKVPSDAERGRELYQRHCAACHGEKAAGDGLMSLSLRAPVPNFQDGFAKRPEAELVQSVLHGKGLMPGFETAFTKDDAEAVVKHMGSVGHAPTPSTKDKKPAVEEDDDNEAGGG